jgi:S-adenosylmethionine hydrolase
MLVLFTDFGLAGPYVGQMKAVLYREAPGVPVVDLFADAPSFNPRAAAYLLAAYVAEFPEGTVFLCVVDPGVGTEARRPVVVKADGRWFVGPDNGLFNVVAKRAHGRQRWEITWRPETLSASFHGRDLFAPVAARLARGEPPEGVDLPWQAEEFRDWPEDLYQVTYVDHFGNAITGVRAQSLGPKALLRVSGRTLTWARTFGEVASGGAFWYENSNGLVEIAVSSGSAVAVLGLEVGSGVEVVR